MGFLDDLKHKADEFGDKAKDTFEHAKDKAGDVFDDAKDKAVDLAGDVKDKASDLVEDVKDRFDGDDEAPAATEAAAPADAYDEVLAEAEHKTPEPPTTPPTV